MMNTRFFGLAILALILCSCADKNSDNDRLEPCGATFCKSGMGCCNGECIDVTSDDNNCGECNHSCGDGFCKDSQCRCGDKSNICAPETTCCGSSCRNLKQAWDACGKCGNVCPSEGNPALHYSIDAEFKQKCVDGACQIKCEENYANVDGDISNGCECGNGVIDGAEECDGKNLNNQTCNTLLGHEGFVSNGILRCKSDCTFDTSGCDGGETPSPNACTEGDYQCEGKVLQQCSNNYWNDVEYCPLNATCDQTNHQCVCQTGTDCNQTIDFDSYPPRIPETIGPENAFTFKLNQAYVQVAANLINDTNAISGKSVMYGENGGVIVSGLTKGVGTVRFNVRAMDNEVEISLLYKQSDLHPESTQKITKTGNAVALEFVVNQDIDKFRISSTGLIVLDDLVWTDLN